MAANYRCRACGCCFPDVVKRETPSSCGTTTTCHCPACGSMDLESIQQYMDIDLNNDHETYLLAHLSDDCAKNYLHGDPQDMTVLLDSAIKCVTACVADELGVTLGRIAMEKITNEAVEAGLKLAKEREPDA